jgi:hypothetical protein
MELTTPLKLFHLSPLYKNMLTLDEIKKKLLEDPLWQPEEDDSQDMWDLYDQAVAEISKSKKANRVKPDIDEIFDDTFPAAAKSRIEDDDDF